uniref:Receptor L-domain domain-containing protein n=1 Tax=Chromera velia CCMP2878 TaxID=1169474 RepID=A0A0G4F1Y4_9ALVE|eukprot:Cvel_14672.t1-p1 / transcript=Cvel_14672.t1 / gene=Cvel_14672 / organism=Chromera_velia_CCMP2878 / gene_product=hypothetical protein / transcript_product=hypothetical protein / location=Cvel_scaffold1052:16081-21195(+) / protein_length=519 / sequence_SO=supercontig / SO=protein_coding / is_pseudo=false
MIRCLGVVGVLSSVALAVPLPELDVEKLRGEFGDLGKGLDLKGLGDLSGGLKVGEFGFDKLNLFDKKDKKKGPCDFTLPIPKGLKCPPPPPAECNNVFTGTFSTTGAESMGGDQVPSLDSNGCDLSPLDGVCKIEGDLIITNCRFTDLKELRSLREVTGKFILSELLFLKNFDDLSSLMTVGGDLDIQNVPLVKRIAPPGFCNLETVGRQLDLDNQSSETWPLELIYFPAVKTVGSLEFDDWNESMTAILFPKLESVFNDIEIDMNTNLQLIYMPELKSVGEAQDGDVEINQNCGDLVIWLPKLETAWFFEIDDNLGLKCVEMSSLKTVLYPNDASAVEIDDNAQLLEVRLDSLETVAGGIDIAENGRLKSLRLPKLQSLGNNLALIGMFSLKNIEIPLLPAIPGVLNLADLPSLESLNLNSLTSIDGDLTITQTLLTDLDTFSNVQNVAGNNTLAIRHNVKMTSAEGLAGAVSVPVFTKEFICDNPLLADLPVSFGGLNEDPVVCDASEPPCDCSFTL